MLKKLLFACTMLLLGMNLTFAQSRNSDQCEVVALDVTGKRPDELDKLQGTKLGTFETIVGEEELTTKVYRLPNTRLFVIASAWYTDESMASEKGADSVSLELLISVKPKRDVLRSLVFADAEMPLDGFDVGRVTTMVKTGRRTLMLIMECRKHIRR